jgi:hypothetical protein
MASLDFVTPNASIAAALLSKDPAEIADDLMAMTAQQKGARSNDWNEIQSKLQIDIRNDLAANLGGEFLVSLDGPVLPRPAWKAVIEVRNSDQLQKTLERLAEAVHNQSQGGEAHSISITSSIAGGQTFYSIQDAQSGSAIAQYTYADGYMIMAADRALISEALRAHDSGQSLGRSQAFKALLPTDDNANYSAIVYQNISPVLTPLLSQFSGSNALALQRFAADARPTAICAWGKDNRIEAASNSQLFGFDLLGLPALLLSGNPRGNAHVRH